MNPVMNLECSFVFYDRRIKEEIEIMNLGKEKFSFNMLTNRHIHFTFKGPKNSITQNGIYHGEIYCKGMFPVLPPALKILTPNGIFKTNINIPLEDIDKKFTFWIPRRTLRDIIETVMNNFSNTPPSNSTCYLYESPLDIFNLAKLSVEWVCPECKKSNLQLFKEDNDISLFTNKDSNSKSNSNESSYYPNNKYIFDQQHSFTKYTMNDYNDVDNNIQEMECIEEEEEENNHDQNYDDDSSI